MYSNFDGKDALFLALLDAQFETRLAPHLEGIERAEALDGALRSNARLMDEWDRVVTDPRLRLADAERYGAGARSRISASIASSPPAGRPACVVCSSTAATISR